MTRREQLLAQLRDAEAALTRRAETNLHAFVAQAWPVVEPARKFADNWHIGAICEHLEAVVAGQIKNLGINVPPSTGKSTIVSVLFPAWVWARPETAEQALRRGVAEARANGSVERRGPEQRFMCASYDQMQSTRDNVRMRDLITSEWYQERWSVAIRSDQNLKTKFGTTAGGWRMGISVGAPRMGEHPHYKIIDDPHNPKKQLLSDLEIQQACEWYDYSFKVRGQMLNASTVLIMQRLHEKDLCGHLRATDGDAWHWLVLPMRWEPKRMVVLPTGWRDPRDPSVPPQSQTVVDASGAARAEPIEQGVGVLLWPHKDAWPPDRVDATYKPGTWGDAGQFQQRPAPAGGLLFKRGDFKIVHARPSDVVAKVRSWDVAGTDEEKKSGGTARTAGVRVELTRSGLFLITDARKGWWGPNDVDKNMKQTADEDGQSVKIREEQEGGSSGGAVINARRKLLAGYDYRGLPKRVDKITSAKPSRSQVEGGNVAILIPLDESGVEDPRAQKWSSEFLDEIEIFPAGTLKDQVDAFTQAVNVLTGVAEPLDISTGAPDEALSPAEQEEADRLLAEKARQDVEDRIKSDGVYWPGGH